MQVHRAVALVDVARLEIEDLRQLLREPFADRRAHLEPHGLAAPAALQLLLDRREQVLDLLVVDVEVRCCA